MPSQNDIAEALSESWDGETSRAGKRWNPINPPMGHCAVSALVLNDFLEGEIYRTLVYSAQGEQIDSHYYNVIDGQRVDVTAGQFEPGDFIDYDNGEEADRKKMLGNANTKQRYMLLRSRVDEKLGLVV